MNIKKPLCILSFAILLSHKVYWQNAESLFTENLLNNFTSEEAFRATGEDGQPKGGYVYRFYLDVTGDGTPEVFLATSLDVVNDNMRWSVYEQDSAGHAHLLAKDVDLYPSFYVSHQGEKTVLGQVRSARHQPDHVIYNTFDSQGNYSRKEKVVAQTDLQASASTEEGYAKFLNLGQKMRPEIEKILLSQYLKNTASSWRAFDRKNDASHQQKDNGDAAAIGANSGFDFRKAKADR
jgi:hypothetical protein